jgi:plasmid replication initiation protein
MENLGRTIMPKVKRNKVESNDLVIYHNQFHRINISKLGSLENNLLFDIFKQLSFKDEIVFSLDRLSKMIYNNNIIPNSDRTQSIVESLHKDFFGLNFKIIYPKKISYIHMFSTMDLNYTDDTHKELVSMSIKVNPDFKYLLQDLSKQFTAFSLLHFKSIRSKYAKTIFRLLSQFSSTGMFRMAYDEFMELLGVPKTYDYKFINNKILKPSLKEVSQFIDGITYSVERERIDGKLTHTNITFKFQKFQNNGEYIGRLDSKINKQRNVLSTLDYRRIIDKEEGKDTNKLDEQINRLEQSQQKSLKRSVRCSK